MLAEAPVRDPSPPQAEGPSAAASPRQMDLAVGGCPCEPPGPSSTDGVSQWEHGHTSIPLKAWPALVMTFSCFVLVGVKYGEFCVFDLAVDTHFLHANHVFFLRIN